MGFEPRKVDTEKATKRINKLVEKYDAVPPPWFMFPDTHPYSIVWRMGYGEVFSYEVFPTWWKEKKEEMGEADRIKYFRRWPPPPRWLCWMINHIWDVDPVGILGNEDEFERRYSQYFEKTEELGFGSQDDFMRDIKIGRPKSANNMKESKVGDMESSSDDTDYEFISDEERSSNGDKTRERD